MITEPITTYLEFHRRSLVKGRMADFHGGLPDPSGLCDAFRKYPEFNMVTPTDEDIDALEDEGKSTWTWASDDLSNRWCEYTPLRQNIVLLMACLAGEL